MSSSPPGRPDRRRRWVVGPDRRRHWVVGPDRRRRWVVAPAGLALLVAGWQAVAVGAGTVAMPTPAATAARLATFPPGALAHGAAQTGGKCALALTATVVIGVPLGICLGTWSPVYETFRPLLMVAQAVPVVSWLTLVIFTWGTGWRGPVFLTFLSCLPLTVLTTVSGVRNLDRSLLEMASVFAVPRGQIVRDIYSGAVLPFVAAALDVGVGQAWKVMLVVEYLCGSDGLGAQILAARGRIDLPAVWALTMVAVALGLLTERTVTATLTRVTRSWQPC